MEPVAPITVTSTGLVMDYSQGPVAPFTSGPIVSTVVPGTILLARGRGVYALPLPFLGKRGTIEVFATMGAAGAQQLIARLCNNLDLFDGVMLKVSDTNVGRCDVTDESGVARAVSDYVGFSFAAGTPVRFVLAWDSETPIYKGRHVYLKCNEVVLQPSNWITDPTAPWTPFIPTYLLVGTPVGAIQPFAGTIQKVTLSSQVLTELDPGSDDTEYAGDSLFADSTVTADLVAVYSVASGLSADSAVTADATVT